MVVNEFSSSPPRRFQAVLVLLIGLALFGCMLVVTPVVYSTSYNERIYPGVSVAGVDLSGLSPAEAAVLLAKHIQYPETGKVVFQNSDVIWTARPYDLGLVLDVKTSVQAAYQVGRKGDVFTRFSEQYRAWQRGLDMPPLLIYDEQTAQNYLKAIAVQVDRPIIEASLTVNGVDVVVHSGQIGRTLDIAAALAGVRTIFPQMVDGIVPLVVNETPPVILDVTAQAELARKMLSAPLVLTVEGAVEGDPGPWTFDQKTLAGMLAIERVQDAAGTRYQVGLNSETLRTFLISIAPSLVRTPQNARFIFNDETRKLDLIQNAVTGRALDIDASIKVINEKLAAGEHAITLDMEYTNPAATDDATAEKLGITQLVSANTTYFYGSSASRIQNIATAADRFHGVLVPPGSTFSMAEVLGDVSLDSGYAEALIIFGDRTIQGVGGGVCQVSTTLFRTAFFGGYQIDERYAHAYRVGYYEQTPSGGHDPDLAGLDATVFAPVVDFRFTNDSQSWILMETYVDAAARTITWKFYSTPDGREISWNTTGPEDIVDPPEPLYEENPDLPKGKIEKVDYEAQGADVHVTRIVKLNGQIIHNDAFVTHYLPWRAVYQYGPGTEGIPTPEPDETATPEP